jgi:hypothetical protein
MAKRVEEVAEVLITEGAWIWVMDPQSLLFCHLWKVRDHRSWWVYQGEADPYRNHEER